MSPTEDVLGGGCVEGMPEDCCSSLHSQGDSANLPGRHRAAHGCQTFLRIIPTRRCDVGMRFQYGWERVRTLACLCGRRRRVGWIQKFSECSSAWDAEPVCWQGPKSSLVKLIASPFGKDYARLGVPPHEQGLLIHNKDLSEEVIWLMWHSTDFEITLVTVRSPKEDMSNGKMQLY